MSNRFQFLTTGIAAVGAFLGLAGLAAAANLTPGNLVVVRVGDGVSALSSGSTAVFLDEYTQGGTFVQTIALPTVAAGSNNPFTNSGTATSEGFLTISANGQFLCHAGYAVTPGFGAVAASTSAAAPRCVAVVAMNGTVDTSTALSGDASYNTVNIRGAATDNGTQFWTSGTAPGASLTDGGVRYIASLGANTSIQLSSTVTNMRAIDIVGGQLYSSSASGAFKGVNAVGTGVPTTTGQTITSLPGMGSGTSQYDFWFADANTLYVADDSAGAGIGGIQKWTLSAGTWSNPYVLAGIPNGVRGITGVVNGGVATIFATTTQTNANTIVAVTDTGAGSLASVVVTGAANTALRGIRLIPGSSGNAYCFGDGSGTACPCGNNSTVGANEGCLSSLTTGGKLVGSGNPSISSDTLLLTGSGMPNNSILYFQGTNQSAGGAGTLFGDGLRCAAGSIVRLKVKVNVAGGSIYPDTGIGEPLISVKGLVSTPGARNYQGWYRNAATFCTASTFNVTNGWAVLWTL